MTPSSRRRSTAAPPTAAPPTAAHLFLLVLVAALLAACGGAPEGDGGASGEAPETATAPALELPDGAGEAAEEITGERLREVIAEISADRYEGRSPGTEGDEMTRAELISRMQALGLEPGGPDGSWEQPFDVVGITSDPPESWSFRAAGKELELAFWDQFIAGSGVQEERSAIDDAEVVFVGYGIEAPEYAWDDYGGADLEGKVLLMLNNDPDWDPALFEGERRLYYGRWRYKYEIAAEKGAVGAIIIHTTPSAGYPWQVVQTSWTGPQFELPAGDEPRLQVAAWTTWDATEELVALTGHRLDELVESAKQRDFRPLPLGIRTSIAFDNEVRRGARTANVLGLLPGGDTELADQVVVYTAHHDHLGRGKPDEDGDEIYNGARDNASGVAVVLGIARAMAALPEPPRRSVLFAFVAAEEQGLLGSQYYAQNPTVPPGQIAGAVNFDSANIWGRTRDVTYIGYGKSTLDAVAEGAAALQDRVVVGDQFPSRGYYYRSDQFSLAKIGVPAIYFSPGTDFRDHDPEWGRQQVDQWTETHYHQQSDELRDGWSFEGMVEDARLGFYAGLAIADADEMPSWNQGDEFEEARLESLSMLGGGGE